MKLFFAGDFFPSDDILDYISLNKNTSEQIFGDLLPHIRKADYSFFNLEYPLTESDHPNPVKKFGPIRKGCEECLLPLSRAGFSHVCLANNHIANYGPVGINDTVKACQKYDLEPVGIILEPNNGYDVCLLELDGYHVFVVNVCENEFSASVGNIPGGNPYNLPLLCDLVKQKACSSDKFILVVHGGTEWNHYPSPRMVADYRLLVDNGYDAIITHHSHLVSAYEKYGTGIIVYGLGNLITSRDWGHGAQSYLGQAIEVDLQNNGQIDYNVVPYYYNKLKHKIQYLSSDDKKNYDTIIESAKTALSDLDLLRSKWEKRISCSAEISYLRIFLRVPYRLYLLSKRTKTLHLLLWILRKRMRMNSTNAGLWNMIRCETHRDVLEYLYKKYYLGI